MTELRVSQSATQVLADGAPALRVSQSVVQVLYAEPSPLIYPTYSNPELMLPRWEFWLCDPLGNRLFPLHPMSCDLVRGNTEDVCSVVIGDGSTDHLTLQNFKDMRIVVYRAGLGGGIMRQEGSFFIRHPKRANRTTSLLGYSPKSLLSRRIVAYAEGSAQATQTDSADDMLKAVVYQNLGAGAPAARQIPGLVVLADQSAALSLTMAFGWKKVDEVVKDICDNSYAAGTPLYWDFLPAGAGWNFQTFINQRGTDRRASSGYNPVVLNEDNENMKLISYELPMEDEANHIYVGGEGTGAGMVYREAESNAQYNSPYNRCEDFLPAREAKSDTAALDAAGLAELNRRRPKIRLAGEIIDNANFRYGVDWDFGDQLTAVAYGEKVDVRVDSVRLTYGSDGKDRVSAQVRV